MAMADRHIQLIDLILNGTAQAASLHIVASCKCKSHTDDIKTVLRGRHNMWSAYRKWGRDRLPYSDFTEDRS